MTTESTRTAKPSPLAIAALVGSNLIPLVGVFALSWDVATILALYWAENIVVAFWAAARMVRVGGLVAIPLVAFFCVHFGIFTFVHGAFVGVFISFGSDARFNVSPLGVVEAVPLLGVAALFASHGVSFVANFLLGGEWRDTTAQAEMAKPYPRMIVLHVAIVVGGFFLMLLGDAVVLLVLLVILKIAVDLGVHVVGHQLREPGDLRTRLASWQASRLPERGA